LRPHPAPRCLGRVERSAGENVEQIAHSRNMG
jgi:hypothetical protein